MGTIYIKYMIILLIVLPSWFTGLSAYTPGGYIGCYDEKALKRLRARNDRSNTGERCIRHCSTGGFRYAATQHTKCSCGNRLVDEYSTAKKCYVECPGNRKELCGGIYDQMSFYEILDTTTSTLSATKPTTIIATTAREAETNSPVLTTTTATETSTAGTTTAIFVAASHTIFIKNDITSLLLSPGKKSTKELVTDTNLRNTEEKHGTPTEMYISIPATVAVVGILAVVALWIFRRTGRKNNLSSGDGCVNRPDTIKDTEAKLTKDDDSVNIYDQCDEVYQSNRAYLTPVMNTEVSYNNRNYETPYTDSTYLQTSSTTSTSQTGREDRHHIGGTKIGANQYESVKPVFGLSGSNYEALNRTQRDANLYETVKPHCGRSEALKQVETDTNQYESIKPNFARSEHNYAVLTGRQKYFTSVE